MKISALMDAIESFAPAQLAEEWDNVGLLIGSPDAELGGPVLLTIDLTEAVAAEAVREKCSAIVAYHPVLFSPVKRIVSGPGSTAAQRVALEVIRAGIAVYSPHTALDAATGGVTDWLADGVLDTAAAAQARSVAGGGGGGVTMAGGDRRALRSQARHDPNQEVKIVTFVPASEVEKVRGALATAGAGIIGRYEVCSFASPGTGTFRGDESTNPTIGRKGEFTTVEEVRLEMVCSRRALALALTTLRQFHPYEEPGVDVYPLEARPDRMVGVGRRITLDTPATLEELCARLKRHLGVPAVHLARATDAGDQDGGGGGGAGGRVSRIGVVPGAGASVAPQALAEGCEVFVTGEMKHHEINAMVSAGMSVILGGHTATERGYLPRFKGILEERLPGAVVKISGADRDLVELR